MEIAFFHFEREYNYNRNSQQKTVISGSPSDKKIVSLGIGKQLIENG